MISNDIALARTHLLQGDVIGLPTETVYGLAGNAFDVNAIEKIYAIKQRPATNPLIVHVGSIEQAASFVKYFPEPLRKLAETFWPGPLTLLLDKNEQIPDVVTAGSHRVAIRVPDHSLTRALLNSLDFPLVAPSANPYTRISPTTAEQVAGYFGDQVPFVLQGGVCQKGIESTIIGWENDQAMVYRLGSLPIEKIESIVGPVRLSTQAKEGVQTPGMARKHYSPTTTLILTDNMEAYCRQHPDKQVGIFLTGMEDPEIIAPVFYARLQEMDKQEFDVLLAGYFPEIGLGRTLNDRLRRAAVS